MGDTVKFTGCSDTQATFFGDCHDPRRHLIEGDEYILEYEDIHDWHTLFFIRGYRSTPFNSACFERVTP